MSNPFDIFQLEDDGGVLWLATAASLEGAKVRIREVARHRSGSYIILNHATGHKIVVRPDSGMA